MKKRLSDPINISFVAFFCFSLVWPLAAIGAAPTPFYTRNLNPFVQVYGLPAVEGGEVTGRGEWSGRLQVEMANSYTRSSVGNESIRLDGESYYATAVFRYGLRDSFELGLDLPYVGHNGGIFDHFIEGWHDTFGLPNAKREERDRNLLEYRYSRDGIVRQIVNESNGGMGDLRLSSGYKFFGSGTSESGRALTFRTMLKLPTGEAEKLRGSGGIDISAAISGSDSLSLSAQGLTLHAMLGGVYTGSSEVLNDIRKDFVGFASVGTGWRFWRKYELTLQFDAHTPFYDSNLTEIGTTAMEVVIGGSVQVSETASLNLAVVEDIIVDTSPDLVLRCGFQETF